MIPTRDSRSVEAMARSGRVLRTLKHSTDDGLNRPEHRETTSWIAEEKMKIWQIDLYHRVTEDGGVNVIKRSTSEAPCTPAGGHSLRPRPNIRPPPKFASDEDYRPEDRESRAQRSAARQAERQNANNQTNQEEKPQVPNYKTHILQERIF